MKIVENPNELSPIPIPPTRINNESSLKGVIGRVELIKCYFKPKVMCLEAQLWLNKLAY